VAILNRGTIIATGKTDDLRQERALEDVFLSLTYDDASAE